MHFSVTCLHGPCHAGCSLGPPYAAAQTSVRGPGTLLSSSSAFADLGLPQGLVHRSQASSRALSQTPHSQSLPALWWDCGNTISSTCCFLNGMRRVRHSWQGFVVEGEGDQEPSRCVVSLRPLFPAQPIRRDTWGSTLHPAQHLCLGRPWPFLVRPLLGQLLLGEPQMAEPDPGGHPSLSPGNVGTSGSLLWTSAWIQRALALPHPFSWGKGWKHIRRGRHAGRKLIQGAEGLIRQAELEKLPELNLGE